MAPQTPALVLLLCCVLGLCSASLHGGCRNYNLQFERVYSVSGEVAMLNSTLLTPSVFNLSAESYNVTWYRQDSKQPISNQSRRVLVLGETLWLLNVTLEDAGEYVTVVSTNRGCYRQRTKLVVDPPLSPCGRPHTAKQTLSKGVTDRVSCPLRDHILKLTQYGLNYSITWYKGCERIPHSQGRVHYWHTYLRVEGVESHDQGLYTCTLTFDLGGVHGSVSETIDAHVRGDYCLMPQVQDPANDVVKAPLGHNLTKRCLVFVPCEGRPLLDVDVYWLVQNNFILDEPSERVYTTQQRTVQSEEGGVWIERWLIFSELKDDDFNLNYTCRAWSGRGSPYCYFTLLHTDPDVLLPVGLTLGSGLLLFLLCVSVYHIFKVDLALWTRGTFSQLYPSTAADGKLYDAYVAIPQSCASGPCSHDLHTFALVTLPRVLEEACGYSLFIPGRDCLPGEALLDSVEENLQASRRILLLYTASTFSKRYCTNDNNNTLLSRPISDKTICSNDHLNTSEIHLNNKDHLNFSEDHLNCPNDHLSSFKDHLNTSEIHLPFEFNKDHPFQTTSPDYLSTKIPLTTMKEQSVSELKSRQEWGGCSQEQSGGDLCGHARTQLECVAAMHRALLERSLKVILVELEELEPSDVLQLPESVRHLRQTQGAVCWWKTRRTPHMCWRTMCSWGTRDTGDVETPLFSCVSPNCRFWKEVRYRMPV